jgi:acyl-CoA synthetase (AMP-forming)/AMP-acid ligase II
MNWTPLAELRGATVIIHRVFDAAAVVEEIERSRVTTVWLAPAMVNAVMALPGIDERDLSSVRLIIGGGEKMPIPLIERLQRAHKEWQTFSSSHGVDLSSMSKPLELIRSLQRIIMMDPPEHDRLRALVSRVFTPRRWQRYDVDEAGCARVAMANVAGYSSVPVVRDG